MNDAPPPAHRLLILDDDPMIGQTIRRIAKMAGWDAEFTTEAELFFTQVQEWCPDIIAIDLIMPGQDGVQVMTELARRTCTAGIIITSGMGGRVLDAASRSASEHGLNILGVLPKPFSPAQLRNLLTTETPAELSSTMPAVNVPQRSSPSLKVADLQQALDQGQIQAFYQPKINCSNGALSGFEALARWRHPAFGFIAPDQFIMLAEAHHMIEKLTEQMAKASLNWFAQFCQSPEIQSQSGINQGQPIKLSLNISALSIGDIALFEQIESYCQDLKILPEQIIFELTETSAMEDPTASLDTLTRLRMKGFQLSLDDFGTGFSSMLQLVRLPFTEIKVDKSFVLTARQSQESRTVVKSIIDLGHSLGLVTTAEGIEDQETFIYLRENGCDLAQGYLIAHPMPAEDVANWIENSGIDALIGKKF